MRQSTYIQIHVIWNQEWGVNSIASEMAQQMMMPMIFILTVARFIDFKFLLISSLFYCHYEHSSFLGEK